MKLTRRQRELLLRAAITGRISSHGTLATTIKILADAGLIEALVWQITEAGRKAVEP